jgi:tetratricopeptide (TPR) repeat protein
MGPDGRGKFSFRGTAEDAQLLQTVLSFYDRFAAQNATNPRLEGEAARAYLKVASLHSFMGRGDDDAEQALRRAIAILDGLVGRYPDERPYRSMLVDAYLLTDPWRAEAGSLDRIESWLRRARQLAEGLAAEAPDDAESARRLVKVLARLGAALQQLNVLDEAEACYRESIRRADELVKRTEWPERVRLDRLAARESLAVLLAERGRRDEALAELGSSAAEIREFPAEQGGMNVPLFDRAEGAAELYRTLGDEEKADALSALAAEIQERRNGGPRDHGPMGRGPRGSR